MMFQCTILELSLIQGNLLGYRQPLSNLCCDLPVDHIYSFIHCMKKKNLFFLFLCFLSTSHGLEKQFKCQSQENDVRFIYSTTFCASKPTLYLGANVSGEVDGAMFVVSTVTAAAASPFQRVPECVAWNSRVQRRWEVGEIKQKCNLLGASSTSWRTPPSPLCSSEAACRRGRRSGGLGVGVIRLCSCAVRRRQHHKRRCGRLELPASGC